MFSLDSTDISVLNADFSLFIPHSLKLKTTSESRNLSVVMDSDLNFGKHIKVITSAYYDEKYIMEKRTNGSAGPGETHPCIYL